MERVNEWGEPVPEFMVAGRLTAQEIASMLRVNMPDRGNRYATRAVRTKGEAAHFQWALICHSTATALGFVRDSEQRRVFLAMCGLTQE